VFVPSYSFSLSLSLSLSPPLSPSLSSLEIIDRSFGRFLPASGVTAARLLDEQSRRKRREWRAELCSPGRRDRPSEDLSIVLGKLPWCPLARYPFLADCCTSRRHPARSEGPAPLQRESHHRAAINFSLFVTLGEHLVPPFPAGLPATRPRAERYSVVERIPNISLSRVHDSAETCRVYSLRSVRKMPCRKIWIVSE